MRNLTKLIAIMTTAVLLIAALITCAAADEQLYTTPVFKLPKERLEAAEEILESREQESEPEESEDPEGEPEDDDWDFDDDDDFEELDEDAGEVTEQPAKQKHEVIIRSSQGKVVSEGEVITLTSELRGFDDDEQVTYQWQVDRRDGNGWVDISSGDRSKYIFIADKETITYSWRLIVNVIDD